MDNNSRSSRGRSLVVWKRKKSTGAEVVEPSDLFPPVPNKPAAPSKSKTCCGGRYELVSFKDLPKYMKDNEFILNYYRANWPLREAFLSLFRWHNETINVWTHLLGFFLFLGLSVANLIDVPEVADFLSGFSWSLPQSIKTNVSHSSDPFFLSVASNLAVSLNQTSVERLATSSAQVAVTRWPFFVFLCGAMVCLLSSSTCHLFCCHSQPMNLFLLRIDYVGITVMIITSYFPPIYYVFQCQQLWQLVYLGGITVMGIFTIITMLTPSLSSPKYRHFRALLFSSMGFFGIVPTVHSLILNWNEPKALETLGYEGAMALSYLMGTMFYATRIPERWRPGWFDLAGHSHQLFHIFVIMGALSHYGAALAFLDWRSNAGCSL
uniref:Uncharacterized protein n=1 Tax=Kalanchoe fedtschenkoi TaxID=63787 RepID=A0A7N0TT97_KALFE